MIKINVKELEKNTAKAAALLRVLSNDQRLRIVCVLYYGEKSVTELRVVTGLRQSAISQHLARLRRAGLVKTRREAQTIHYSLTKEIRGELLHSLQDFHHAEGAATA